MTLTQAIRLLPKFAKGLAEEASTIRELRLRVAFEIQSAMRGENPLEAKQIDALREYLAKTSS